MEGDKRRTGAVRRVGRSFECSRLAEQLLISAYERVVPLIRQAMRRDPPPARSVVASAETEAQASPRMGTACL